VTDADAVTGGLQLTTRELVVSTTQRVEVVDLTDQLAAAVQASGARHGLVHVAALHTTVALFVERPETVDAALARMVEPEAGSPWVPPAAARGAGGAPPFGHAISLQVAEGRLVLGDWQRVLLAEWDGPRPRQLRVQVWGVADGTRPR